MASSFCLKDGLILLSSGEIRVGCVEVRNGIISRVAERDYTPENGVLLVDVKGKTVVPGFIDIHVNGGGGAAFDRATECDIDVILSTFVVHGTTSMVGALNTAPADDRINALRHIKGWQASGTDFAEFLGVYLEGPYYNPEQRGAHNEAWMHDPDPEEYLPWLEEFGDLIRVFSLAPELDGSVDLIRELSSRGIVPAIGHSQATDEAVLEAIGAGARLVSHLYNAQSAFQRTDQGKHLGVAEMGLMRDALTVEIIPDGHHLTPTMLDFILKVKARDKICLTTDAMEATGKGPGKYIVMGQVVWVEDGVAFREDRKRHAGSILTMDHGVRNLMRSGASLSEAVAMAPSG